MFLLYCGTHKAGQSDPWHPCTCSAAYIVALLHDGFGVGMEDRSIAFAGGVRSPEGIELGLDWTLGDAPPTHHCYIIILLCPYSLLH